MKKEIGKEKTKHDDFNQGRQSCDRKWVDAIDERIIELEKEVGIPELKRLKREWKYRWK